MNKLKVVTLCSGYDSQCMALDRLGIDYDLVAWSEIDKYAIKAHNAVYPEYADRNLGDMTKIDWSAQPFDIDILTYSTPCQSVSNAGKQEGITEGSNTASSILWATRNVIIEKRPKYLLMENVKALVQSKFIKQFNQWQLELESYGYTNYAKVLNAKDYGIPQNRERIFMVSIRNDVNKKFVFPKPFKLEKRLKDILESDVDEKYYLSDKLVQCFLNRNKINAERGNGFKFEAKKKDSVANAISTNNGSRDCDNNISDIPICLNSKVDGKQPSLQDRIYDTNGTMPAITTGFKPNIFYKGKKLKEGDGLYVPTSEDFFRGGLEGISRTIKALAQDAGVVNNSRIRKLTPIECFRLMGVDKENIELLLNSEISNSQLYKLAGNSIVVDCLYYIFKNLLCETHNYEQQLTLF